MRLSSAQIQQFRTDGYTVVPDIFTPREVDGMRAELDRLLIDGLLRNVRTEGDGKTHSTERMNLQICPIWPKSTFFRALPFKPGIADTVGKLIGDPFVFYLDQIFLKPGKVGVGTHWHQDNAYFKIPDPSKGTGMWIAIHDATVANGTMHIIPRSHLVQYPHERDPESDHHIFCRPPEDEAIPIEVKAGGALFFNYGIAHCTRDNTTDRDRAGLALHFVNADVLPAEVLAREPAKRGYAYLSGPKASGGREEYGTTIAGTWEAEIARVLRERETRRKAA